MNRGRLPRHGLGFFLNLGSSYGLFLLTLVPIWFIVKRGLRVGAPMLPHKSDTPTAFRLGPNVPRPYICATQRLSAIIMGGRSVVPPPLQFRRGEG